MLCHGMHVYFNALELVSPKSVYAYRTTMYGGYFHMLPNGQEEPPYSIQTPERTFRLGVPIRPLECLGMTAE
jgi:hypothetical protein